MIRVGYVPYSKDLQHPGDRRRLEVWAHAKKTELNTTNPVDSDVLVLSSAANFGYWLKRVKQPIVLDLVDGYLGENPSFAKDLARNIVRSIKGTSSLHWITYTRHLRKACQMSEAVIVASPEQRELVLPFNKNVYVILDDHSEVEPNLSATMNAAPSPISSARKPHIFWEGFGFTLKHFNFMAKDLDRFLQESKWSMYLVTVEEFARWGGYIGKIKTGKLIKKMFPLSWRSIEIVPWSLENLAVYAKESEFGIIPIDPSDKFASLKSENKLLSMWHLRLPVLFSDTPSYSRVAKTARVEAATVASDSWGEALRGISAAPADLEMLRKRGSAYVNMTHTKEILLDKWNTALVNAMERTHGSL